MTVDDSPQSKRRWYRCGFLSLLVEICGRNAAVNADQNFDQLQRLWRSRWEISIINAEFPPACNKDDEIQ
jgi:hypothetical protein